MHCAIFVMKVTTLTWNIFKRRISTELNREEGVLLVLATHNEDLARRLAARVRLKDGRAFLDQVPSDPAYLGMVPDPSGESA